MGCHYHNIYAADCISFKLLHHHCANNITLPKINTWLFVLFWLIIRWLSFIIALHNKTWRTNDSEVKIALVVEKFDRFSINWLIVLTRIIILLIPYYICIVCAELKTFKFWPGCFWNYNHLYKCWMACFAKL